MSGPRGLFLAIRCTREERERWALAAKTAGVSLSEIVRVHLDTVAARVQSEQRRASARTDAPRIGAGESR